MAGSGVFENILDNISSAVYTRDKDYNILYMNSAAEKLSGWSRCDAMKKKCFEVFGSANGDCCDKCPSFKVINRDSNYEAHEIELITNSGGTREVNKSARPLIEDGKIVGAVITLEDVTDSKLMERDLKASREKAEIANFSKTQFIANISHEIRTPMNGIVGFAEMISHTDLNPEQRKLLKYIKNSSEVLFSIVTDIIDFSSIESGKMNIRNSEFNLKQTVFEIVSAATVSAVEKGLKLSYSIDEKLRYNVIGDANRLRQVVLNLLNNSVKFSEKGSISFDVSVVSETDGEIGLKFVISDEGIGIAPEMMSRLFIPFAQIDSSTKRKKHGTGIGLVISDNLVRLMGGTKISVESVPGSGSRFYFTINFKKASAQACYNYQAPEYEVISKSETAYKILIAEDNFINAEMIKHFLKLLGHDTVEAENGQMALEFIKKEKFDLVLMDIQMPVMDGHEAVREIRRLGYDVPVIALTASMVGGDRESCLRSGMNEHMLKPVNINELKVLIDRTLKDREKAKK